MVEWMRRLNSSGQSPILQPGKTDAVGVPAAPGTATGKRAAQLCPAPFAIFAMNSSDRRFISSIETSSMCVAKPQ
jgi:hypothetical protein